MDAERTEQRAAEGRRGAQNGGTLRDTEKRAAEEHRAEGR